RLDIPHDTFLYIGRLVDARVLGHLDRTRGAVQLYSQLEGRRYGMEITFALIFVVVALMLLLAVIWVGLTIADHLTVPIGNLIAAAGRVAKGDLTARVDTEDAEDEIGNLSTAFNSMTSELESQQSELLAANRMLDNRNQFIEAVLGGVSAGVIGVNSEGWITLPNRAACELLEASPEELRDKHLADVMPGVAGMLDEARARPSRLLEHSVNFQRLDGSTSILLVRITVEQDDRGIFGYVVTFDDMTDLQAAQRKAAWSDIARRIAHEIKNPLTPIQLSAERLRRKYLKQISEEPETFQTCTDTIIRHVEDIGRMVNEFSSFARMPIPVMAEENLVELVDGALFLQRSAAPDIRFDTDYPEGPVLQSCDSRQIGRAITNLLLNATEAIQKRQAQEAEAGDQPTPGHITVAVLDGTNGVVVEVQDNGCGLPVTELHRLTEPYVTTRERGTGLGLAIVKKIMEEHGGDLLLRQSPEGGAKVALRFPKKTVGLRRRDRGVYDERQEEPLAK
ncbi:MAG TPA: ATP-binding protein, partial [Kiloniellaceae bacterium]|nr:ATP-binding protein [Kiloniellaceae bacterium]